MNLDEVEVLEKLAEVYNSLVALERLHPNELDDAIPHISRAPALGYGSRGDQKQSFVFHVGHSGENSMISPEEAYLRLVIESWCKRSKLTTRKELPIFGRNGVSVKFYAREICVW